MATAQQQAARNRKILLARVKGQPVSEIAAAHDLTPARVRQILAGSVQVLAEDRVDPVQVAFEVRAELGLVLADAKALAREIPIENAAAKIGALKLVLVALERLAEWQRYLGVLPAPSLAVELDAREVAAEMLDLFERRGVDHDVLEEVIQLVDPGNSHPSTRHRARRLPTTQIFVCSIGPGTTKGARNPDGCQGVAENVRPHKDAVTQNRVFAGAFVDPQSRPEPPTVSGRVPRSARPEPERPYRRLPVAPLVTSARTRSRSFTVSFRGSPFDFLMQPPQLAPLRLGQVVLGALVDERRRGDQLRPRDAPPGLDERDD